MTEEEMKFQMEEWKDKHQAVFASEINDIWFVWRGLSRAEFKKAMEYYDDDHDRAEYVCRLCVLDPVGFDFTDDEYAGIPEILVQNILRESGFSEGTTKLSELMGKYEQEMQSFENQISCVISECFPHLDIEEIENWSMEKTIWYFSRAKWMLETLRGVTLTQEKQG